MAIAKQVPNVLCLMLASLLPAQKVPVAGSPDRMLQVIDLRPMMPEDTEHAIVGVAPRPLGVEAFVRQFVEPALGPDDDVRLLGRHRLAVLGSPQQAAWVENLVAKGVEHREHAITVQVQLFGLSAAFFDQHVRALLAGKDAANEQDQVVQGNLEQIARLTLLRRCTEQEGCRVLQSVVLCLQSLSSGNVRLGDQLTYVADYQRDPDAKEPVPVSKTLFDGHVIDVMAAFLGNDRIAIQCEVTQSEVQKPLPEAKLSLGGDPLTIQVPRCRTATCQRSTVLKSSGTTAVATRREDGSWFVVVLTVSQMDLSRK